MYTADQAGDRRPYMIHVTRDRLTAKFSESQTKTAMAADNFSPHAVQMSVIPYIILTNGKWKMYTSILAAGNRDNFHVDGQAEFT